MTKKLNEVSHKVKADASFLIRVKKGNYILQGKQNIKTRYKYETKKMWQVIEHRKKISYLTLMFKTFSLNVTGLVS